MTTPQPSVSEPPRFSDPVDEWLAREEVETKPGAAVQQFMREDAPLTTTVARSSAVRPKPLRRTHWRDGSGAEMRSQTYMEGLAPQPREETLDRRGRAFGYCGRGDCRVVHSGCPVGVGRARDFPYLAGDTAGGCAPDAPETVQPPAPVAPAVAGAYRVEVALFTTEARAARAVAELIDAGLPAHQQPLTLGSRKVLEQAIAGPFATRGEAEAHLIRVRETGGYQDARIGTQ